MSKKLDSILNQVPHATAQKNEEITMEQSKSEKINSTYILEESFERIVAIVPRSLKKQIKIYLIEHPSDTEKTVILRGLKKMGFAIQDDWLTDKRGKR